MGVQIQTYRKQFPKVIFDKERTELSSILPFIRLTRETHVDGTVAYLGSHISLRLLENLPASIL